MWRKLRWGPGRGEAGYGLSVDNVITNPDDAFENDGGILKCHKLSPKRKRYAL